MNGAGLPPCAPDDRRVRFRPASAREAHREPDLGWVATYLLPLPIPLAIAFLNDFGLSPDRLRDHTALVEVEGSLAEDAPANAECIFAGVPEAFKARRAKTIILRVNSPGGSRVQAGKFRAEILRLRSKYGKPIYSVVGEQCQAAG